MYNCMLAGNLILYWNCILVYIKHNKIGNIHTIYTFKVGGSIVVTVYGSGSSGFFLFESIIRGKKNTLIILMFFYADYHYYSLNCSNDKHYTGYYLSIRQ